MLNISKNTLKNCKTHKDSWCQRYFAVTLSSFPSSTVRHIRTTDYLFTLLRFMLVVMDMLLRVAVELTEAVSLIALTSGAFPSILRSSSRNLRKKMSIRVRIVVRVGLTC